MKWKPWAVGTIAMLALACHKRVPTRSGEPRTGAAPAKPARPPIPARAPQAPLGAGETYRYDKGVATKTSVADARAAGLLDVDLGDGWAPLIFQDGDPPKPNAYRETFVALAGERIDEDGRAPRPGEHNYLEVFGIPPTLSVLAARIEED